MRSGSEDIKVVEKEDSEEDEEEEVDEETVNLKDIFSFRLGFWLICIEFMFAYGM